MFWQPTAAACIGELLLGDGKVSSTYFLDELDQGIYSIQHDSLSFARCLHIGW